MREYNLCSKCEDKFDERGIAKARGIQFFKCINCGERATNFIDAQTRLCAECCRKLHNCSFCGNTMVNK